MEDDTTIKLDKNGTADLLAKPAVDAVSNEDQQPCLQESNGKNGPRRRRFVADTEAALREKTGLSPKGLRVAGALLLVLVLLFVAVFSMAVLWPRLPHHLRFDVCRNSACLRAAAQVSSLSDGMQHTPLETKKNCMQPEFLVSCSKFVIRVGILHS